MHAPVKPEERGKSGERGKPGEREQPSTSREKVGGPSSKEVKGKHSKWISFLNDFNMQYTNEN